jgi:hypothetical protein
VRLGRARFTVAVIACVAFSGACAGPRAPQLRPAAHENCDWGFQPLPDCQSDPGESASTVESVVEARRSERVTVVGRFVIGAQCNEDCRSDLIPALAPTDTRGPAPSTGPLLLLTSRYLVDQDRPFRETLLDLRFPGRCRRSDTEYCCGLDVSGQLVSATGSAIAPPPTRKRPVLAIGGSCGPPPDGPRMLQPELPGLPRCELTADFRDLDEMWGFAAESVCRLPELTAGARR